MGWSKSARIHHPLKDQWVRLQGHRLPLWSPPHHRIRQWNIVWLRRVQGVLRRLPDQEGLLISHPALGQWVGQSCEQDNQAQPKDEAWKLEKKVGRRPPRGALDLQDHHQINNWRNAILASLRIQSHGPSWTWCRLPEKGQLWPRVKYDLTMTRALFSQRKMARLATSGRDVSTIHCLVLQLEGEDEEIPRKRPCPQKSSVQQTGPRS